jgi:S1-C subfamily serine protease
MIDIDSRSKALLLAASTLLMSMTMPAANADDGVELKALAPQVDTSPPIDETQSAPAETVAPKLHKLEASKRGRIEGTEDTSEQTATVQIGAPLTTKRIYFNTFTVRASVPSAVIGDPFTLMRAMLGSRGNDYAKLYAERDTGYGVCGFLMSIPTEKRGYSLILKCYPTTPAAQAGLQPGDLITSVNGKSTLELPPKEIWDYFTGMPDTEVKIEVLRNDEPISVSLKRMDIGHIPDFATRAEFLTVYKHNGMSKFVQR